MSRYLSRPVPLLASLLLLITAVIALGAGNRRFFGGRKDDRPQIQA
jgi:hypothetical protein